MQKNVLRGPLKMIKCTMKALLDLPIYVVSGQCCYVSPRVVLSLVHLTSINLKLYLKNHIS